MEFCNALCCLCNERGVNPVNYSGYHQFCLDSQHLSHRNSRIICLHCDSNVIITSLLDKLICTYCNSNYRAVTYACNHGICPCCDIYQCPECKKPCCRKCRSSEPECCDNCLENYCHECNTFRKPCLNCKLLSCVCEEGGEFYHECRGRVCENCGSLGFEEKKLECGDSGCSECLITQRCLRCRPQLVSNSIIGVDNMEENLSRRDKLVDQKSDSLIFESSHRENTSFIGSRTVSFATTCEFCYEQDDTLNILPCTHKLCNNCSDRQTCLVCERNSNKILNASIIFQKELIPSMKESHCSIDMSAYSMITCQGCDSKDNMLKILHCRHALCGNCSNHTPCIVCEKMNRSCVKCQSTDCAASKICGHWFCKKCIFNECPKCKGGKCKKKCCSCEEKSNYYKKLECNHNLCYTCEAKQYPCQKCRKFQCERCQNRCSKIFSKSCGHKLCSGCYKEEANNAKCSICKITVCKMCKEKNFKEQLFICGHIGCEYCFSPDIKCYHCTFSKRWRKTEIKRLKQQNEVENCFRCKGILECIRLMCGHFICEKCINAYSVIDLNYLCYDCCLRKVKTCIQCGSSCIWEAHAKDLYKICCKKHFCGTCFKKRSGLGRLLKECSCSFDELDLFSGIQ